METREMKISEYVDAFVSKSPVLGGGGVSAVVGALAAAAGEMVCALTTGKEKYAGIEPEIRGIEKRLNEAGTKLLELADKDAEAFEPLAAAYKASDVSEEEMDMLYEQAASVPLEVMRTVYSIIDEIQFLAENGSRLAVSDAACAAVYARAAIEGELLTVLINTKNIKNSEIREEIESESKSICEFAEKTCDSIFRKVLEGMN